MEHQILALDPKALKEQHEASRRTRLYLGGGAPIDPEQVRVWRVAGIDEQIEELNGQLVKPENLLDIPNIQAQIDELRANRRLIQSGYGTSFNRKGQLYGTNDVGVKRISDYSTRQGRRDEIAQMSPPERFQAVLERLRDGDLISDEIKDRINELLNGKNFVLFVAVAGAAAVSQATGVGEIADVFAAVMFGQQVFDIGDDLSDGLATALFARSDDDFDRAAHEIARGLTKIETTLAVTEVGHLAGKAIKSTIKSTHDILLEKQRLKQFRGARAAEPIAPREMEAPANAGPEGVRSAESNVAATTSGGKASVKEILSASEQKTIKLSDPNWGKTQFANGKDSVAYILRDAHTGELLKVGKSEVSTFKGRFGPYERAGEFAGRNLEVDTFAFRSNEISPETVESQIRSQLTSQGEKLPWDNTRVPGSGGEGRLGRPGPGVPGTRPSRTLREQGWRWVGEKFTRD